MLKIRRDESCVPVRVRFGAPPIEPVHRVDDRLSMAVKSAITKLFPPEQMVNVIASLHAAALEMRRLSDNLL